MNEMNIILLGLKLFAWFGVFWMLLSKHEFLRFFSFLPAAFFALVSTYFFAAAGLSVHSISNYIASLGAPILITGIMIYIRKKNKTPNLAIQWTNDQRTKRPIG